MRIGVSTFRDRIHPWAPITVGIGLIGLLLWSRFAGIGQSLWHDEIYSVTHYMTSPTAPFTEPYIPNNHVLYNVLSAVTIAWLHETELVVRLWSVIPGIASIVLLGAWLIHRGAVWSGLAVAGFLTVSPVHMGLSRQARGYGLTFLAMSGLIVFGARYVDTGCKRDLLIFGTFGAIGVFTLPVFVLPFLCAVIAVVVSGRAVLGALVSVGSVAIGSLAWYGPMLTDVFDSTGQEFGHRLGLADLLLEPTQLVEPTYRLVARHVPMVLWASLTVLLTVLAIMKLRSWLALSKATGVVTILSLGPYVTFWLLGFHLEDRFVSYQLLPLAVVAVVGASSLLATGSEARRWVALGVLLGASVLASASFVRHVQLVEDRPQEAFQDAGKVVNQVEDAPVVTNSVRPLGLDYYIDRPVRALRGEELDSFLCHEKSPFIFIDHSVLIRSPDTNCLRERGAKLLSFEQRSRGDQLDVWIVQDGNSP